MSEKQSQPAWKRIRNIFTCECSRSLVAEDDTGAIVVKARPVLIREGFLARCHKCGRVNLLPDEVLDEILLRIMTLRVDEHGEATIVVGDQKLDIRLSKTTA